MKITFSVEHTTNDGKTHKPDSTTELDPSEARHVMFLGHGRPADVDTPAKSDASTKARTKATTRKAKKPTDKKSEEQG